MADKNKIAELRKSGLSCRRVAEMCGCSYQYVANISCGYTRRFVGKCIYPFIEDYLYKNKMTLGDFASVFAQDGKVIDTATIRNRLSGKTRFTMEEIRTCISFFKQPFEVIFNVQEEQ